MIDYSVDILFYERSRQEVRDLSNKYKRLHRSCEGIPEDISSGLSDATRVYGCCLNAAHEQVTIFYREEGEYYSFDEILFNYGCDKCNEAWSLKRGDLALARQRFGQSKRNLARIGKSIIKSHEHSTER